MERDERIKAAKEKLKKFQKKRQGTSSQIETIGSSTPDVLDRPNVTNSFPESLRGSTPQSEMSIGSKGMPYLISQLAESDDLAVRNKSESPPLFTFQPQVGEQQEDEFFVGQAPSAPLPEAETEDKNGNVGAMSISDQITQVLTTSNAELIDDGNFETTSLNARLVQLEREKKGLNCTIQQQTVALRQWEAHSQELVSYFFNF